MSRHVFPLGSSEPMFQSEDGSLFEANSDSMPILDRLSAKRLLLNRGAIREPHWHANASELTYCVSGRLLVSILDSGDQFSVFEIGPGQMFHIRSGSIHHIENIGEGQAELIVAFRHEAPRDFSFRSALGAMSDAVLGNTYSLSASAFSRIPREGEASYILHRQGEPAVPDSAAFDSPFKFDVEAQSPPIQSPAGSARVARNDVWPALQDISMYSLRISDQGMREPHWHPETAEMGYVVSGRARMTVLDPDGSTDTYELAAGDLYFIPRAYPHHIEDLSPGEFHFLVFFDQPFPGDIGYRASATAYSREVLAATFGMPVADLPELPFTPSDPLIVDRINPVDPA